MKKRWLGILLALCLLVCLAPAALAAETDSPADPIKVYVDGEQGDDTNGNGSQESPYATLATAVKEAAKEHSATIYVMSDLTMSECARFWTGNITITSAPDAATPYTIFRGKDLSHIDENESVDPVQDMARGGYNPALIEVGNAASLTLENIVLDDRYIMAYTYEGNEGYTDKDNPVFVQVDASRGGNATDDDTSNDHLLPGSTTVGETNVSNFEIVQDAIIATYSGDATITVGDGAVINSSQCNESTIDAGAHVGPFAYIRPNCHVGKDVKVGDFVELKNSTIGDGTKISHLTYIGDSDVGSQCNFGCGTVVVNYDGKKKYRTTIGNHCFVGCNTNLVSPVRLGDWAYTAAGSTITQDVPAGQLAIARARQVNKDHWKDRRDLPSDR